MTTRFHVPDHTVENMDVRAQRLKVLLATIDVASAHLGIGIIEGWSDAKTAGTAPGHLGAVFVARRRYRDAGGE